MLTPHKMSTCHSCRLLRLLSNHLPHTTVIVVSDEDVLDKEQPNYTMAACLVNTLRLLFNIIHDNGQFVLLSTTITVVTLGQTCESTST